MWRSLECSLGQVGRRARVTSLLGNFSGGVLAAETGKFWILDRWTGREEECRLRLEEN